MQQINIILDYKSRFESKFTAIPYRSGFDKDLLRHYFYEFGFEVSFISFPEIDFRDPKTGSQLYIYCSSEDHNNFYKSYIEDIVLGLKVLGACIIPDYIFLRAQNNKLFMEILRDIRGDKSLKNLQSYYFGTVEELHTKETDFKKGQFVIKPSMGAASEGVTKATSFANLLNDAKKIGRSLNLFEELKDIIRVLKYKGYISDSKFRKKFIVQNMIYGLDGDWKVLIYGDKYYVLRRENRKNDFRASGSGLLSYRRDLPTGLLDYAKNVYLKIQVPTLSIDIAFDGSNYYLIEFQALYFGSYTIEHSEFHFIQEDNNWTLKEGKSILELEYSRSISSYINDNLSR